MNWDEEPQKDFTTTLRRLSEEVEKGEVRLLDFKTVNGTKEIPGRHGIERQELTGEQWITLHIQCRAVLA